jgi:hypothetical protein
MQTHQDSLSDRGRSVTAARGRFSYSASYDGVMCRDVARDELVAIVVSVR